MSSNDLSWRTVEAIQKLRLIKNVDLIEDND